MHTGKRWRWKKNRKRSQRGCVGERGGGVGAMRGALGPSNHPHAPNHRREFDLRDGAGSLMYIYRHGRGDPETHCKTVLPYDQLSGCGLHFVSSVPRAFCLRPVIDKGSTTTISHKTSNGGDAISFESGLHDPQCRWKRVAVRLGIHTRITCQGALTDGILEEICVQSGKR